MIDQMIIELGETALDTGGHGLRGVGPFEYAAHFPGDEPEEGHGSRGANEPTGLTNPQQQIQRAECGQPRQGCRQSPGSQHLNLPALESVPEAFQGWNI